MKRRSTRLAALAAGLGLLLTGCSSGSGGDPSASPSASAPVTNPTPTAEDIAALDAVKITGDAGAAPTVTFDAPFSVSAAVARVELPGTGDDLKDGQSLDMNVVAYNGEDGTLTEDSWASGATQSLTLDSTSLLPSIYEALQGQKVGVRFVIGLPATADSAAGVLVGEITKAVSRAEGEAVTPPEGLPTVTLDDTGKPSITIPDGYTAPTELVAQTLIKGAGPVVTETQTVTAHYTGWLLDGTQFDSSWDRGAPSIFSLQGVVAGWTQGLTGQTVGSQVLLVVPAELGYGDKENGGIPANSVLVFVVDILAAQ